MSDRWHVAPLGGHCTVKARIGWRGLSSSEYMADGPFLIAGKHVRDGEISWDSCDHISEFRYRESMEIALEPGDVILTKDGTIGRVARVDTLPGAATLNGTMMLLRPREGLDYRYLFHVLRGKQFRRLIDDKVSGSSIPHIFQRDMVTLPIALPPTEQQRAIANVLDTLDTTIRQTEAIIEKLDQIKQGLLHDLLTRGIDANGELRLPQSQAPHLYKDSPLGWIPREWEDKPLGRTIADAYRYPSYFGIDYVDSGVPEVRGELIKADGTLDARTENYRHISKVTATRFTRVHLRQDDVVMSVRGTIGKFALVPARLEGAVITANLLKLTPDRNVVRADWLIRLLLSQRFQEPLDAACSSTTIKTIQVPELMAIRIAVPSLAEQQAANDRLNAIDGVHTAEAATLAKLRLQKSGLMDDLLTGSVRVTPLLESTS